MVNTNYRVLIIPRSIQKAKQRKFINVSQESMDLLLDESQRTGLFKVRVVKAILQRTTTGKNSITPKNKVTQVIKDLISESGD